MEIRDIVNDSNISGKLQHAYKFIHENNVDFNFTIQELYNELSTKYNSIELHDSEGKNYIIINLQNDETKTAIDITINDHNEWSKFVISSNYLDEKTIVIKPVSL